MSSSQPTDADRAELWDLAVRYARGVDRREQETFVGVFHPGGRIEISKPRAIDVVGRTVEGPEELGQVTENITRYERTLHFLGQAEYSVDGDQATGEIYCMAHHITEKEDGATDVIMYIRYEDEYTRRDGRWGIQVRRLRHEWSELRPVLPAG